MTTVGDNISFSEAEQLVLSVRDEYSDKLFEHDRTGTRFWLPKDIFPKSVQPYLWFTAGLFKNSFKRISNHHRFTHPIAASHLFHYVNDPGDGVDTEKALLAIIGHDTFEDALLYNGKRYNQQARRLDPRFLEAWEDTINLSIPEGVKDHFRDLGLTTNQWNGMHKLFAITQALGTGRQYLLPALLCETLDNQLDPIQPNGDRKLPTRKTLLVAHFTERYASRMVANVHRICMAQPGVDYAAAVDEVGEIVHAYDEHGDRLETLVHDYRINCGLKPSGDSGANPVVRRIDVA